jgi:hypothetical protein
MCLMIAGFDCLAESARPRFVDRSQAAGLRLANVSGNEQKFIVEGMMGGSALFDYDGDGDLDLYVTNGSRFEGFADGEHPANRLFRNDGGAADSFSDVSVISGAADTSWSMGCVVGDTDNDGDLDLYVTNFGRNTHLVNDGAGVFADLTDSLGTGDRRWGTGATFGDYDLDGDLDLYVANYVAFSRDAKSTIPCLWKNLPVYCGPQGLTPAADILYRNDGLRFRDVTQQKGIVSGPYFGMATTFVDLDADGWPELIVANDSTPNQLYRNVAGSFTDIALESGVAYGGEGGTQGCMGLAVGDYDGDGLFDLFFTNFADEYNVLYRNEGDLLFGDVSHLSRVASLGSRQVAWGTAFFDYDNDGDLDLYVANGHTYPQADLPQVNSSYRSVDLLWENSGDATFQEVSAEVGLGDAAVSRGAAFGDIDNDGDVDVFVVNLNGFPALWSNHGGNRNHWLIVELEGVDSNRRGVGARVTLTAADHTSYAVKTAGGSYLSHSDGRLHFGLGERSVVERLEVRWPSGVHQILTGIAANQILAVREPE